MLLKIKALFIISLFLLSTPFLTSSHAISHVSDRLNSIGIQYQASSQFVKYSSYLDPNSTNVNIHSVFLDNQSLFFNDFLLPSNEITNDPGFTVPLSSLHNFTSIIDFNSYASGSTRFLLLSRWFNHSTFLDLYVFGSSNSSFTLPGYFNIVKITQFYYSPHVLFIVQNSTSFLILKYNFDSHLLTTFFHTDTNAILGNIFSVNTFMLDNKVYISFIIKKQVTNDLIGSSVFIISPTDILFNKIYYQYDFVTFTPYQNGLVFFSNSNSTFFDYRFTTDQITKFMSSNNYGFDPVFAPFDNYSFVDLRPEALSIITIDQNNGNPVLNYQYTYKALRIYNSRYNQSSIQAFSIQDSKFYIYSGDSFYQHFYIHFNQINEEVQEVFRPNALASTAISTSEEPAVLNIQSFIWFFIFIGIIIFLLAFMIFKFKGVPFRNQNSNFSFKPRKKSDLINKNFILNNCPVCGTHILSGDLFCQECGNQIR